MTKPTIPTIPTYFQYVREFSSAEIKNFAETYKASDGKLLTHSHRLAVSTFIETRYNRLPDYKIEAVKLVSGQPYEIAEDMLEDWYIYERLNISIDHLESPIMDSITNLKSRIVHDYIHNEYRLDFSLQDEYLAYLATVSILDGLWMRSNNYSSYDKLLIKRVMFSEIVLQASHKIYFNEFAENQKLVLVPAFDKYLDLPNEKNGEKIND